VPQTSRPAPDSSAPLAPPLAVLLVAAGGVIGALARAGVAALLPTRAATWPWATLVVNAVGAAALCALLARAPGAGARLLLGTGLLGGFTTFSAFAVETVLLVDAGRPGTAIGYVAASLASLLAGGALGAALARRPRARGQAR
jgi:CrcB protein